jgi:hypothetical protein
LHALVWTGAAWLGWGFVFASGWLQPDGYPITASYLALALTGCAGMAVLGARRPGVTAWNFVVAGLLIVLHLPLAEGWGEPRFGLLRTAFFAAMLLIIPFNYLPTRFGFAALVLAAGSGLDLTALVGHTGMSSATWLDSLLVWGRLLVAGSPWAAWAMAKMPRRSHSEFEQIWLGFRDRFGLTWALRVREQFNRAAANAGWTARLGWSELGGEADGEMTSTLRALLRRFGPAIDP